MFGTIVRLQLENANLKRALEACLDARRGQGCSDPTSTPCIASGASLLSRCCSWRSITFRPSLSRRLRAPSRSSSAISIPTKVDKATGAAEIARLKRCFRRGRVCPCHSPSCLVDAGVAAGSRGGSSRVCDADVEKVAVPKLVDSCGKSICGTP